MTAASTNAPVRLGLHGSLLLLTAALLLTFGPGKAIAADPGVVEVYGYQWSQEYKVNLNTLPSTPATVDGEQVETYSLLDVLDSAEGQQSPAGKDFTVAALSKIEIVFPGNRGKVTYSGSQIRNNSAGLATFYVDDQNVTVMRVPGRGPGGTAAEFEYDTLNPQLYQPKQSFRNFSVSVSPTQKTVKSGTKLTFTATTQGLPGGVTPTYIWSINGAIQSSSGPSLSSNFSGKSGKSFAISLSVTASGYNTATGGAQVFIDKATKKKPKKDKPPENQDQPNDNDYYDPGDVPGYGDGYYDDGPGTGSGIPSTGSPSPSSPEPDKQKQEEQPVDDSGETVTGQLIDPTQIATVVPPSETPATGSTEEASPADDGSGGGGGIPAGVKTALGIGALLGIGGLAEAGAFSGALRRFRLRP